ncbi:MAG: SIMPL domain-containing protein [Fibrobacter sp.]|jgi:uncharacterized protein YggE|uniref:SIMPL domain-containing protein n=1 Tax=Fibrobacter sp. UWP2 TaxID=1896216 RepID=UPI0009221421|nr:SIMPL domain-containing protein [Fibrobacter sp. UWP2]MCR5377731.1 SIMPL domain-containing protein [Fibrobacter sp.]SHJ21607.1 hypothetical protein SAMN05720471_12130 [Fibrobacter sp. UWP2]
MKFGMISGIVFWALVFTGCDCCKNTPEVPKVDVSGSKSQKYAANQFVSTFSLELRDASKDGVYKKLTERRQRIFEVTKSIDVDESGVEQNSVSLTKEWSYDHGDRRLVGYVARQEFSVKLDSRKDAAMLTQLLSTEPDVEIYPTSATVKNLDSLQGVVIEAAVKNGLAKASHYAAGAGLKLGKVLYIGGDEAGVIRLGARRSKSMLYMANATDAAGTLDENSIADSVEVQAKVHLSIELK